jgi:squalene synthase HpnC
VIETGPAQAGAVESPLVTDAYRACRTLVQSHYENFMVASVFTPRRLRRYMWALYAYARTVDDIGDEASGDRRRLLDEAERAVRDCAQGRRTSPLFIALGDTIDRCRLPLEPFLALIDANRRDQDPTPFQTFAELASYCQGSAQTVGRLVLRIFGYDDPELDTLSDHTTTALQLVNFYQDLRVDAHRGRLYLPLDEMERFGVRREDLVAESMTRPLAALLRYSYDRAWGLFEAGRPLERRVSRALARQLALYRGGGMAVLSGLEAHLARGRLDRPALSTSRKIRLLLRVLVGGAA